MKSLNAILLAVILISCNQNKINKKDLSDAKDTISFKLSKIGTQKVTLLEFGTSRCKPCVQMQKVIDAIAHKYSKDVKVIYFDAWSDKEVKYARHFNVRTIPVQIFLDADGNEFFRHLGYYPEKEIIKVLDNKFDTSTNFYKQKTCRKL